MTTSRDPRSPAAAPSPHVNYQQTSGQRTPPKPYFSASPSPPPSTPPPSPPTAPKKVVPYISRVTTSESRRRKYVRVGLQQFDIQESAYASGQPIPAVDCSGLDMSDFNQESSNENAVERFCVWDWVEDSNVIHARTAMAEFEKEHEKNARVEE